MSIKKRFLNFKRYTKLIILSIVLLPNINPLVSQVYINEFLASNSSVNFDPDYNEYSDWFELYNSGSNNVDLSGFYLTDDLSNPAKYQIPIGINIPAGEFLIFWADDNDTLTHTNFNLSSSGEQLGLFDTDTIVVDTLNFGPQNTDLSFGTVVENISIWNYFDEPTPGNSNTTTGYQGFADDIEFSIEAGFYTGGQTLELSTPSSTAEIRYTIDGTFPSENSLLYTSPITFSNTTVIKAISYDTSMFDGRPFTNSYIIDHNNTLDCVVSISTNPGNFFDPDSGIYMNVDSLWERPVNMEVFEGNGERSLNQIFGFRIKGGKSRSLPQKSFGIYSRSYYGEGKIRYRFFEDKDHHVFNNIVLRNSGQDWFKTMFRDGFFQDLVKTNMDVDYQEFRPTEAYINGEYWGILNFREKINEHYIKRNHPSVDIENIDVLEITVFDDDDVSIVMGDLESYNQLTNHMESNNMNLQSTLDYIDSRVDLTEFSNHFITNIFIGNTDWPQNNIKWWREKNEDGKWRWIFFDLDYGFGYRDSLQLNTLERTTNPSTGGNPAATFMLRKLLENDTYKNDFIQRFSTHLNTTFNPDRVNSFIDEKKQHIEAEILNHISRWEADGGIASFSEWEDNISVLRYHANNRPAIVREDLEDKFLIEQVNLTVNNSGEGSGKILIHDVEIGDLPFNGIYYKDIPFIIEAKANYGYRFIGWDENIGVNSDSILITLTSDSTITAIFEAVATESDNIVINEINYNSSDDFDSGDWIEIYNNSEEYVEISNWMIKDENPEPDFIFPYSTLLEPNGYLVICRNYSLFSEKYPEVLNYIIGLNFGLDGGGEHVELFNSSNIIVDSLRYNDHSPWPEEPDGNGPTLELKNPILNNSLGENWQGSFEHGSPGEKNTTYISSKIIMNEFNYNSPEDFNPDDWMEFYNPGDVAIDLYGWSFQDEDVAPMYIFPYNSIVEPNGYLVLCRFADQFHSLFPDVENYIGDLGFGFSGGGDMLRLFDQDMNLIDSLIYNDVAPWPTEPDGQGPTLELINYQTDNSLVSNWAASLIDYGTPGEDNTVATSIGDSYELQITNYELEQNYPNPFNPVTKICYQLAVNSEQLAKIVIFNSAGQSVWSKNLSTDHSSPITGYCIFDGSRFNSGVYFYSLVIDGKKMISRKMILIK